MSDIRHTVWITLLIGAATAVILIPTQPTESFDPVDPIRLRIGQADRRFAIESELYRRAQSRVIAHTAEAQEPADKGLSIVVLPGLPADVEHSMRVFANRELSTLPRRDTSIRIVLAALVDTGWALGDMPISSVGSRSWSNDVFPPGTIADNACVTVTRVHWVGLFTETFRNQSFNTYQWPQPVGPCWWYAAFGRPGAGMATWLRSLHYAPFDDELYNFAYDWNSWRNNDWPAQTSTLNWIGRSPSRFSMAACVSGVAEKCASLMFANIEDEFEEGGYRVLTPEWIGRRRNFNILQNFNALSLLRRLQGEMGPADFERLWKSDQPLPDAFRAVHGGSITDWIRTEALKVVPPILDRPLPGWTSLALLALAIALVIGAGLKSVARRSGFA